MDDTTSTHSMESADTSRPLPITFGQWKDACMRKGAPSDKHKIRAQATQIFAFLSKNVEHKTPENIVMTTKSSHNEALAQLTQELGPAFSPDAPSYGSRICALYCICGAIEACSDAGLSYKIIDLLGNFFLGQCGPLDFEADVDDDTDDQVRDAAVLCLSALVRTRIQEPPDQPDALQQAVQLHLDLARRGVERRCAAPDTDDEMQYDHGYDFPATSDIRGGLSTLPRSRRSLCFDLVRAAIDGLVSVPYAALSKTSVKSNLASFASFADNCLHGESDPRCLLQLLGMLHASQTNMLPFFQTATSGVSFPILDLFDAVAPYYPIQFTPPPNDVYGITRKGLHQALMSVLCFTAFDAMATGNDTMLNLSAGIFLERLLDVDSEEGNTPSSADDKLDAIPDLSSLLFPANACMCDQLSEDTVRELSTVLFAIHSEAASRASAEGENGKKYKTLADACRDLVSKSAVAFETSSRPALWKIFVRDTVQTRCQSLSTSPQSSQGRSSIAYLACLASSGGPRTMNLCLQSCLPPLIDILDNEKDEEKVTAALYGIGAFFSSFQAAVERGISGGVALHPHPLEEYSANVSRSLFRLMAIGTEGESSTFKAASPPLYIACVHALESVLTVTPLSLLEESDIDLIIALLDALANLVESADEIYVSDIDNADLLLGKAASRTLGSSLGASLDDASDEASGVKLRCVIDDSSQIRTHLRDTIYPKLLMASEREIPPKDEMDPLRFDWSTLAYACEMNRSSATRVVLDLVDSLNNALIRKDSVIPTQRRKIQIAARFSFVIEHGGALAVRAFSSLSKPNISPVDLITSLCSLEATSIEKAAARASPEKTGITRVSALMLPPTNEDKDDIDEMVERAYEILPYLLPAYEHPSSETLRKDLINGVSHVLPPLSVWQRGQLCVMLPFLSAVLSNGKAALQTDESSVLDSFRSMVPHLTDCALSSDFDARARSAAATCLYQVITQFQDIDAAGCISRIALINSVIPSMIEAVEKLKVASDVVAEKAMVNLCEVFDVAALLGTAAACRGKSSSKTADDVARFLIQLSCDGEAKLPFAKDSTLFDISETTKLYFAAASAFGTMVSTEDSGPFWRQRLMHLATRYLTQCSNDLDTKSILSAAALTPSEIGRLMISCFVIASSGATLIGKNTVDMLADRIMLDFSRIYANGSETNIAMKELGLLMFSVKEMVLSAILKLMAVAPETVRKYKSTLVPSLLHAYTDWSSENPMQVLPCKILALQGLFNAAAFPEQAALKSVVVAVLSSATDDPTSALRRAAVDTRNSWFTLS